MTDLLHPETKAILFSHAELACKKTGEVKLANGFASALVSFRVAYNRPLHPSSCCRSALHNKDVGGHERSLHVFDKPFHPVEGTCAIDFEMTDIFDRYRMVALATSMYWSVGVHKQFVHMDRRQLAGLKGNVMFVY